MNRRSFIKGMAVVTASGFILPGIIVPEEPEKRFWALGGLPQKRYEIIGYAHPQYLGVENVYGTRYTAKAPIKESNSFSDFEPCSVLLDRHTNERLWRTPDRIHGNFLMSGNVLVMGAKKLDSR